MAKLPVLKRWRLNVLVPINDIGGVARVPSDWNLVQTSIGAMMELSGEVMTQSSVTAATTTNSGLAVDLVDGAFDGDFDVDFAAFWNQYNVNPWPRPVVWNRQQLY
jgi:hypothetical protein